MLIENNTCLEACYVDDMPAQTTQRTNDRMSECNCQNTTIHRSILGVSLTDTIAPADYLGGLKTIYTIDPTLSEDATEVELVPLESCSIVQVRACERDSCFFQLTWLTQRPPPRNHKRNGWRGERGAYLHTRTDLRVVWRYFVACLSRLASCSPTGACPKWCPL